MTEVITVGNFKGGVGKTTTCVMLAYALQDEHKKTLLVDFDPQANATSIMKLTYGFDPKSVPVSFFEGLERKNLSRSIIKCNDYLDLIPADWDLAQLAGILMRYSAKDRDYVLAYLLEQIKDNYDYVIIDTPPTISDYTNNALAACDYFLIIMQTQQQSYESSMKFINYAASFRQEHGLDYDLLGIVPYLVDKRGNVDNSIIKDAKKEYQDAVTNTIIYNRQRVKQYGRMGIRPRENKGEWDNWDKDVLGMYHYLLGELLGRISVWREQ